MFTKTNITLAIAVIALVVGVTGLVGGNQSVQQLGGTTNFDAMTLDSGNLTLSAGTISQTTTGTSTIKLLTSSATKGTCIEGYATSSNTKINGTFAASTTAATTAGIAFILNYGACP